jgi:glycogen operon protein
MLAETVADHGARENCFVYCAVNTYWEKRAMELPIIPANMAWTKVAYTFEKDVRASTVTKGTITLEPRSLMLLIGR